MLPCSFKFDDKLFSILIEKYKKTHHNDDKLSEYLGNSLQNITNIRQRILGQEERIEEEGVRHQNILKEIQQNITQLQNECEHLVRKYHPDPSGNNDSWTQCQICVKEV